MSRKHPIIDKYGCDVTIKDQPQREYVVTLKGFPDITAGESPDIGDALEQLEFYAKGTFAEMGKAGQPIPEPKPAEPSISELCAFWCRYCNFGLQPIKELSLYRHPIGAGFETCYATMILEARDAVEKTRNEAEN